MLQKTPVLAAGDLGDRSALAVGENADGSPTLYVMRPEDGSVLVLPASEGSRKPSATAVAN
jgi:hypothetical protein